MGGPKTKKEVSSNKFERVQNVVAHLDDAANAPRLFKKNHKSWWEIDRIVN